LHSEYATPFWINVKPVDDQCKLLLWRVFMSWICELSKNNFLLVATKRSKENIYWDGRGNIRSWLNNGQHVSRLLEFVIIRIILFWILKMLILWWELPQNVAVITEISFAAVEFMILQCSFYIVGIWTVRFMSAINEYEVRWEEKNWKSCWIVIEIWCLYECTSLLTRPFLLSQGNHDLVTSGHSW
jgi:hypothetical protein